MKFLDDLIVTAVLSCLRGAMVIGTGFAYFQAFVLALFSAMLGTLSLAAVVALIQHALL